MALLIAKALNGMSRPCIRSSRTVLLHRAGSRVAAPVLAAAAPLSTRVRVLCEISPPNHGTRPLTSFKDIKQLDRRLRDALCGANLVRPTTIQAHAVPLLIGGEDVMASAQTGSGKTAMFTIPMIHRLLSEPRRGRRSGAIAPSALVLSPTRELAAQIARLATQLGSPAGLRVVLATGGADMRRQREELARGCDVMVGTPGRVLQWAEERVVSLRSTTEVVVDEADRMLDLGFEPQLRRIARLFERPPSAGTPHRHTVFCSATFPAEVQRLASDFLRPNYYFVAAGRVGATHSRIAQRLLWEGGGEVARQAAAVREVRAFRNNPWGITGLPSSVPARALVFVNTKLAADQLGKLLGSVRGGVRVVHGDRGQHERNRALADFREGRCSTLVATDVAARGLDVPEVGLVVQCDMPRDADTFVHRVGRTGRAGASGSAVALVDGRALSVSPRLVEVLSEAAQPVPAWLVGMAHVASARRLDEAGAIAAGGGGDLESLPTVVAPDVVAGVDDAAVGEANFTLQDFRSRAAEGSWGSARDTTYRSFEREAYGEGAPAVVDGTPGVGTPDVTLDALDCLQPAPNEGFGSGVGEGHVVDTAMPACGPDEHFPTSAASATSAKHAASDVDRSVTARADVLVQRERVQLSSELRAVLRKETGSERPSATPDQRVLRALRRHQRDSSPARFEYLGLFPFDAVSEWLSASSRGPGAARAGGSDSQELPRLLMVAEKPSIAKAIADALSGKGGPRQRRGISRALPVYEFNTNGFAPIGGDQRCVATVTSVVGHVFSLGFVEDGVRRDDPSSYFTAEVVKQEEGSTGKLRVVDHLRSLAADVDHLVLWLDCDAEGENIAHEVIGVTRRAMQLSEARRLSESGDANGDAGDDSPIRRVHRARFSAITHDALTAAFHELGQPNAVPNPALSRSVDARQELDLRVGVAMTRMLTWRCVGAARRHFAPSTKLVSYGPCQTPTLHFCVERAREIERFEPTQLWTVAVEVAAQRARVALRWLPHESVAAAYDTPAQELHRGGVAAPASTFNEAVAKCVIRQLKGVGRLRVARVAEVQESRRPPDGLNTVKLLVAGSKAMGMSPKQVMKTAEALYSQGFISYPRTGTCTRPHLGMRPPKDLHSVVR